MRRFQVSAVLASLLAVGCGREAIVTSELPVKRVVVYRNGVAYFERGGHVEEERVRFKMRASEVGDFLATLAVMEQGGSSVRAAAFPLAGDEQDAKNAQDREDKKKGLETVVLSLDGRAHDLQVGYVAEAPVWRPSYRLVVRAGGEADLQAWGIVQNLSGENWENVSLSLVAGAPLAFDSRLGTPVIPTRPTVTDQGEVIVAVPRAETTLDQRDRDDKGRGGGEDESKEQAQGPVDLLGAIGGGPSFAAANAPSAGVVDGKAAGAGRAAAAKKSASEPARLPRGSVASTLAPASPPPPPPMERAPSPPRNVRSLAAVAVEAGTTRYDLPLPVTVPDKSATMVMLLSKRVRGEAVYLFAPDAGVPDSSSHPFRVARFSNGAGGTLERGPIAVFEDGSFLGQGIVEPLPRDATATVPFALERAIAVDQDRKYDQQGARIAKIENGELTIERDAVTQTKYRARNGGDQPAKLLVRHPRVPGTRLHQPPAGTDDNVGTATALVPSTVAPHATAEFVVDERAAMRLSADWFSAVADAAFKAYVADPLRADREIVAKLTAAWAIRNDIVKRAEARADLQRQYDDLSRSTEETRRNMRAIEKNHTADALRAKLLARLTEASGKMDDLNKRIVELDAKLAELRVQFKESIRDIKLLAAPVAAKS